MTTREEAVSIVAARHGLSEAAAGTLWDALARGGGRMAQFSHPDLGGMGQWSGGGMVQIGDMFNQALKARVAAACADLAEAATDRVVATSPVDRWRDAGRDWWPGDFGRPSAAGSQNGLRYACFEGARRLAIERDGHVTLYDTGHHHIFGVSQRQSQGQDLAFTADDGTIDLSSLEVVQG